MAIDLLREQENVHSLMRRQVHLLLTCNCATRRMLDASLCCCCYSSTTQQYLEKRPNVPAVRQQVRRAAGVSPDPHLRVRLIDINRVRRVARSLQAGHHALVAGLAPGIFLPRMGRGGQVVIVLFWASSCFSCCTSIWLCK